MTDKPFWEREFTPLDKALNPFVEVEPIPLTDVERETLKTNLTSLLIPDSRFLTIYKVNDLPYEHLQNAEKILIPKLTTLEDDYGYELIWVSVYRSLEHHLRIYAAKGIIDHIHIPMQSNHLKFLAGDAKPKDMPIKHLHSWLTANGEAKLKEHNLFMEHENYTPSWAHVSPVPFASYVPNETHTRRFVP